MMKCDSLDWWNGTALQGREREIRLYSPLVGTTMLELGCKYNRHLGISYKSTFEGLGYRHVSIDWNGLYGSLPLDLRFPLRIGCFDMVTNIGTTEHVDGQRGVWENILAALHEGSILVCMTPYPGDVKHHGAWRPTQKFYERLADVNGMWIESLHVDGDKPNRQICFRAMMQDPDRPLCVPTALIEHNPHATI